MATRRGWGVALAELDRMFDSAGSTLGLDRARASDAVLLEQFALHRDEAAFSALVERHGPMVLRTARGIVGSPDDADDVFQATFLTLARRASGVRSGASVAPWLHQVARRAAIRTLGRRQRSTPLAPRPRTGGKTDPDQQPGPPGPDPARAEADRLLHAEIDRLPAAFRQAVVLCDLEGLARDEAADRLGWPAGTVASRLSRGRLLLRDRLTRRLGGAEAWLGDGPGSRSSLPYPLPVPPALLARVLGAAPGVLRPTLAARAAATLAGLLRGGWTIGRAVVPLAVVLVAVALGATVAVRGGWLVAGLPLLGNAPPPTDGRPRLASDLVLLPPPRPTRANRVMASALPNTTASTNKLLAVRGRVVDPSGRAVGPADLYQVASTADPDSPARPIARTDPAGEFALTLPAPRPGEPAATLLAVVPGFGPGRMRVDASGAAEVRLTPLAPPVLGRVELPPLAEPGPDPRNVRFRPLVLLAPRQEDLTPTSSFAALKDWQAASTGAGSVPLAEGVEAVGPSPASLGVAVEPTSPTGFSIRGIGHGWLLLGAIEGPGLATQVVVLAPGLEGPPNRSEGLPAVGPRSLLIVASDFTHRAVPSHRIEGTIRDAATGQTIPGVEVAVSDALTPLGVGTLVRARSDADGRFALDGLTEGADARIEVRPGLETPHLGLGRTVGRETPPGPQEFRLRLGIWATGRVVDPDSRRPRRARIEAFMRQDEPAARPVATGDLHLAATTWTDAEGRFRLPIASGRSILTATTGDPRDAVGIGLDTPEKADFPRGADNALATLPTPLDPRRVNSMVLIETTANVPEVDSTIYVGASTPVRGVVLGPDGVPPSSEVVAWNLTADGQATPLIDGRFEVLGLVPGRPRRVYFRQDEAGLVGFLELASIVVGPVEVRLRTWASYELGVGDATEHPIDGRFRIALRNAAVNPLLDEWGEPPVRDRPLPDGRHELSGFDPTLTYDVLFRTPSLGDIVIMDQLQLRAGDRVSRGIYAVRADGISAL